MAMCVNSVQPKVSIRVDGATELGTKISQSEAAAANVRVMPELNFVADWQPQRLNSDLTRPLAELTLNVVCLLSVCPQELSIPVHRQGWHLSVTIEFGVRGFLAKYNLSEMSQYIDWFKFPSHKLEKPDGKYFYLGSYTPLTSTSNEPGSFVSTTFHAAFDFRHQRSVSEPDFFFKFSTPFSDLA